MHSIQFINAPINARRSANHSPAHLGRDTVLPFTWARCTSCALPRTPKRQNAMLTTAYATADVSWLGTAYLPPLGEVLHINQEVSIPSLALRERPSDGPDDPLDDVAISCAGVTLLALTSEVIPRVWPVLPLSNFLYILPKTKMSS